MTPPQASNPGARDRQREETRERRIQQTLEWLAEGKPRNWKYM